MEENRLGRQVALLRDRFGYTQEDLATKLGVSKQTVSNWETGLKSPRMGAIEKMADLFKVSKGFIIDGTDDSQGRLLPIFNQLSKENKNRVIDFSIDLLSQQAPKVVSYQPKEDIEIHTLAAHRIDETATTSPEEKEKLHAKLDEMDRKFDEKQKRINAAKEANRGDSDE